MPSLERRTTLSLYLLGAVILAVIWIAVLMGGRSIVEAAVEGRVFASLGRAIRLHMTNNPEHAAIDYFVALAADASARALLVWIVFGAALLALQKRFGDVITRFFRADEDALTLAITRLVVFTVIGLSVSVDGIVNLASQPREMVQAPQLMGWLVEIVPLDPEVAKWAARVLIVTALLAAIGAFTRTTAVLTVIMAIYVLGIPQFYGKVSHGMHGLLWIAMILAVSPSGAALSADRILGRAPEPARARVFGLPIRMIWFLFACIYFFPGFWKFVISGWDWALSENLKFKMYSAWRGSDYIPAFRLDQYPILYQGSALISMLWEIAFPLLILFRRTRVAALALGGIFHVGVWEFMRIGPPLILFGYVAFVNWGSVVAWIRGWRQAYDVDLEPARLTRVGGGIVCGLVFIFGAFLIDSWPFSVYPTHAGIRGPTYQKVEMVVISPSGASTPVDITSVASTSAQTVDFAVLASPDSAARNAYLEGLAARWRQTTGSVGADVQFYRSVRYLDPDRDGDAPVRRELLLVVDGEGRSDSETQGS